MGPLSFSFSDGVTTTTNATPGLINDLFAFYTNGAGNITYWAVAIVSPRIKILLQTLSSMTSPPPLVARRLLRERGAWAACTGVPLGIQAKSSPQQTWRRSKRLRVRINGAGAVANMPGVWTMSVSGLAGGTSSSPLYLATGPNIPVAGTIGGEGTQDYYLFDWSGGAFSATATVTGANVDGSYLFSVGAARDL